MKQKLTWLIFGAIIAVSVLSLQAVPTSAASQPGDKFDVSRFFCKTRYGLMIEGDAARREACQKGFDEGECAANSPDDSDGTIKACNEGKLAFKDLRPEPEVASNVAPTVATPEPPRLQAQSGTQSCGNVDTAFLSCQIPAAFGLQGTGLGALLNIIINIMAALVGIVAIGAFVFAGIIYASSRDNEGQLKRAKDIIKNTVIGLVMFMALYAGIQFIVPGGVF